MMRDKAWRGWPETLTCPDCHERFNVPESETFADSMLCPHCHYVIQRRKKGLLRMMCRILWEGMPGEGFSRPGLHLKFGFLIALAAALLIVFFSWLIPGM